ncbi:methionyl-tRNA formyltransferase [Clostridia bacterium]|nr:methionyl-tRNA formyltransferase [Clostridia bacterium]
MRIIFMGTPDFASESLLALIAEGYDIPLVFTKPDKPQGRGMKLRFSSVKEVCLTHGIECVQPETLKDDACFERAAALEPDVIVVAAYGLFLSKRYLELPKYACINVHGSLLPKYRGAAPIQRAVINGETRTGVCTMHMAKAMDAGDVILSKDCEISENDTYGTLYDKLKVLGARALTETLPRIFDGSAPRIPQDEALVTFAPPVTRGDVEIDWGRPAREVYNLIRGANPAPIATAWGLKILGARLTDECAPSPSVIRCGDGNYLRITVVQAPGKKPMSAEDYLRGHKSLAGG